MKSLCLFFLCVFFLTACVNTAQQPARPSPAAIAASYTTVVGSAFFSYNTYDDSPSPQVFRTPPICEAMECRLPVSARGNGFHPSFSLPFGGAQIPSSRITKRNNIAFYRDDASTRTDLRAFPFRWLARGKITSFGIYPSSVYMIAFGGGQGQDPAPANTPLPHGTWAGTATFRSLDNETGMADAVLTHDPDTGRISMTVSEFSGMFKSRGQTFNGIKFPNLELDGDKLTKPYLSPFTPYVSGRIHGANHDEIVVIFDVHSRRLVGGAILQRQHEISASIDSNH